MAYLTSVRSATRFLGAHEAHKDRIKTIDDVIDRTARYSARPGVWDIGATKTGFIVHIAPDGRYMEFSLAELSLEAIESRISGCSILIALWQLYPIEKRQISGYIIYDVRPRPIVLPEGFRYRGEASTIPIVLDVGKMKALDPWEMYKNEDQ